MLKSARMFWTITMLFFVTLLFSNNASGKFLFFGGEEQLTAQQKALAAKKLEERKDVEERAKREAKQRAEAKREEKAQLKRLNKQAKKQTEEQISQAKIEKKEQLKALDEREKSQSQSIKEKRAQLKGKYKEDAAALKSEYKQSIKDAAKPEKSQAKTDYEEKLSRLKLDYKDGLAKLNKEEEDLEEQTVQEKKQIEDNYLQKSAKINMGLKRQMEEASIAQINLPEDTSARFTVEEIRISGNTLIPTDELLENIPAIFNASKSLLSEAESLALYNLRDIQDVMLEPDESHKVSARSIQGLTQYILSIYQQRNYAGIYVYVPSEAIDAQQKLKEGVLPIQVLEALVSAVAVRAYDPNQNPVEEGFLKSSYVKDWSPVKAGEVANQKELDDFINLLNINPDRYVSGVVTKGATPKSLSVEYDIYEANPWHWFVQVDNAGTKDKRWVPRVGVINTNLLGIDDTFNVVYQAPWEKGIEDEYSIYGSYDFPLIGPRLRLNVYGGYSQYDVSGNAGINFIGNGDFYGGVLRYNALQTEPDTWLLGDGWFLDVKGMLEHTRSKVTPSIFPMYLGSNVHFWMWGYGLDLHRSDDLSKTSVGLESWESMGGESGAAEFIAARTGAESDFSIYSAVANHSQYLDPNKVGRFSGSFRWVGSDERLAPAKMTSFGGMYSVRGYDEYEVVADGGILASLQYEFDLVKYGQTLNPQQQGQAQDQMKKQPFLRKLAPLAFVDYGRSTIRNPVAGIGEKRHEEMCSAGGGLLLELGDNFSGGVYYGYPLLDTPGTRTGDGRLNVNLMYRW